MKEVQKATMAPGDLLAIYQALDRVQAIIEFDLDGTVVSANENFLRIFGYELDEVVGKHHRIFCDPSYVESDAYAEFWKKLGRGESHHAGEGRSSNPVLEAGSKGRQGDLAPGLLQSRCFDLRIGRKTASRDREVRDNMTSPHRSSRSPSSKGRSAPSKGHRL